jgi:acyl-coenzyme A synthetase/AMP-(fatty) acid ligase
MLHHTKPLMQHSIARCSSILVDENGKVVLKEIMYSGNLCIKFPWPGIIRTTYNDHERCKQTYFSTYENMYFTGDGCFVMKKVIIESQVELMMY